MSYKNIGKTALMRIENKTGDTILVAVTIKDYKFAYGCHRYLVTPVSGEGEMWTEKVEISE